MAIEQHVEELRAELSWCDDPAERRQIAADLEAAQAQQQRDRDTERKVGRR